MNPSLRAFRLSLLIIAAVASQGCALMFGLEGVFPSRSMDYKKAEAAPALALPPGMRSVKRVELYPVPDTKARKDAFTPVDEDDIPKPTGLLSVNVEAGVEIRSSEDNRWLVVRRDAESVHAAVRNFLDSNGFRMEKDDRASGVIETGWLRPRETERPGVLKRVFTLNFRDAYDKFRFRLESDASGVLVHIDQVHAEVFSDDSLPAEVDWGTDADDPTLTEVMASDLSDFIAEEQVNSLRTGVLASAYANAPRTIMTWDGNGFPVLVVTLDMNRAWIAVGDALAKADIKVRDFDRTLGIYYLPRTPAGDTKQKDEEDKEEDEDEDSLALKSDQYQLKVLRSDEGVHLSVQLDDNTLAPADEAQRLLETLRRYIQ